MNKKRTIIGIFLLNMYAYSIDNQEYGFMLSANNPI